MTGDCLTATKSSSVINQTCANRQRSWRASLGPTDKAMGGGGIG